MVGMVWVCVLVDTIFISGSFQRLDISINISGMSGKSNRAMLRHDENRSKNTKDRVTHASPI